MKLLSCHIENFGKLKDFTYYFEDDLNVLFAENGWGKSTFAAFLRVMFYGFDGENRRNEDGNERLRYRPWGGGVYGGSVTWSSGSKTYRMMRTFGARKKEDKFSLYDDRTGFISGDYTDRIGEELFAIDRESFCRTVFWSQSDHETSATTSIQAKIGDLAAQQDDLPAYDAAVKRLRREMERLRPDRASGLIRKKEDRLKVLEADEARLPALTAQLKECGAMEQELTEELNRIRSQKQAYALSAPQPSVQAAERGRPAESREGLAAVHSEGLAADKEDLAAGGGDLAASGGDLEAARASLAFAEENLASARDKLSSLRAARRRTLSRGQREREQYLQVKRDLRRELDASAIRQKKQRDRIRAAAAACILLSVILLALCLSGALPKIFLLLPALLLAAGGLVFRYSVQLSGSGSPAQESEELLRLRDEKERCSSSLRALSKNLRLTDDRIREQQLLCESLSSRIRKLKASAASTMDSAKEDIIPSEIARTLRDFDVREEDCRSRLQDIRQQSEELQGMIRDCRASQESIPALRSEIRDLREQYDTCAKTLSYLEEARNLFTSRYMNPFLRSFRRYYSMLTGESADSVRTDADLGITLLDQGLPRDPALMSEGTRDMISLCRRMAMIDAMYPGEKPFLVLDDPFSNLDDERIKGGMRFLHDASLEYQILYLTCHGSRL